jgi:hypothetical protein
MILARLLTMSYLTQNVKVIKTALEEMVDKPSKPM